LHRAAFSASYVRSNLSSYLMNEATKHFQRVQVIFDEVAGLPEGRRETRLDELCGSDEELMDDVSSLLSALVEELSTSGSLRELAHGENGLAGKRIGAYEIENLLGRGGMGAVYLAHRADGEYNKKVAIKLIDLPLATSLFRERFRNERQILAGLDHPLIARMLDGGVSADGNPYLVMEYVQGVPIHTFCTEHGLSLRQRLRLFLGVCEAVQFAHQNLVVHRDLKPDNILVDGEGKPHLLDFGTAKLLSASEPDLKSAFTREGFLSFTPQYASPEQVLGKPITTASDTYSLGVLLYVLISNKVPYELKEFSTAEMVRVICEQAPRRMTAATEFRAKLDGDLEAIVYKALRKEPEQRYGTAQQMHLDVQAYLESRPVSARQGTIRYKAAKLIKRNRLSFSIAAILLVILVGGSILIAWQARIANRQRHIAEARSTDLRELSNSLLSELDDAIKQIPGSTNAQQLLVTRVLEHLDRMSKDADGDRIAELDLADAYTTLGKLQGDAYEQNLGDKPGAIKSLDKAVAMAMPLAKQNQQDVTALTTLARAEDARGEVLSQTDDNNGAATSLKESIESYKKLLELPGVTPALLFEAADVYDILGDVMGQDTGFGDAAAALENYHKTIEINHRALVMDPDFMRVRRGLVTMQMKIGNVQLETDPAAAMANFDAALSANDALPKREQERLNMLRLHALLLRKKADALSELGRYDESVNLFSQSLTEYRKLALADSKDIRALEDIHRELYDEASSYRRASDPQLNSSAASRQQSLGAAERVLMEDEATLRQLLAIEPNASRLRTPLDAVRVQMSTVRYRLHKQQNEQATQSALADLKKDALRDDASPLVLELVVTAFLQAEPISLGDPAYAVLQAKRGVDLTHHKSATWLLMLAQAYRADGKAVEARSAAEAGIALLPPAGGAVDRSRVRKLLDAERVYGVKP
jgi:serine/threonine protein kinase